MTTLSARGSSQPLLGGRQVEAFSDLMRERTGLEIPPSRRSELEWAVARAVAEAGVADADTLLELLAHDTSGQGVGTLFEGLTVGETYFFRDPTQLEALERVILPDLISRRRPLRRLRIWSAGCSSGEEPYSVAILLTRLLPDLDEWEVSILATDIDHAALAKARAARYGSWSFRGVPEAVVDRYFARHGQQLELDPSVRSLVRFEYLNLVQDVYPSLLGGTCGVDLILCRNALMYFGSDTAARVITDLGSALSSDGWLVLGVSDPLPSQQTGLVMSRPPGGAAFQRAAAAEAARADPTGDSVPAAGLKVLPSATDDSSGPVRTAPEARATWARVDQGAADDPAALPSEYVGGQSAYLAAKACADGLEFDAAERWIELALESRPLDASYYLLHGLILQEAGRLDEAIAALRRCLVADDRFVLGHCALAGLLTRMGRPRPARHLLEVTERLLEGRTADEPVEGGEGLSIERLRDLVGRHKALLDQTGSAEQA